MKKRNNTNWTHLVISQGSHDNEFLGSLEECEAWIDAGAEGKSPMKEKTFRRNFFIIKKGQ